MHKCRFYL